MKLFQRLQSFFDSLKVDLCMISGTCKSNGRQASLVCGVGKKTLHYLADLIFEPGCRFDQLGSAWLWSAERRARRSAPEALLLFIESGGRKLRLFNDSWINIPVWVRSEIALPMPEAIQKRQSFRSDLSNICKASYTHQVTRDPALIEDFYHQMYLPYVGSSHGDSAILKSKELLLSEFGSPELLLIKQGQTAIAGVLISYEYEIPKIFALGIREDKFEHLRHGALFACYYFALAHLGNAGYQRVSAGSSKGFIRDGVLNYKHKFGHRLVEPQELCLLLKRLQTTAKATELLRELPVICQRNGLLYSLVFVNNEELKTLQRSAKARSKFFVPGSEALLACNLDSQENSSGHSFITLEEKH